MNNFYKNGEVVVYVLVKYCLSTDIALFSQLLFSPIGKKKHYTGTCPMLTKHLKSSGQKTTKE